MPSASANSTAKRQPASRAWEALTPALSEWILEAVSSMGFDRMTPVQASTIPLFTGNKDVVVEAVTGSGKTLAFLVPMIEKLLKLDEPTRKHHIGAVVISPTRELATQIYQVLTSLLAFHPPSAAHLDSPDQNEGSEATPTASASSSALKVIPQLLLGGTTTPAQDLAHFLTYSPNLLISTPGRLLELLSSPHVHCPQSSFEVLVLDEADRLLDLGFKNDLQKILQRLPKQRRTGLFSASVSEAVDQLVRVGLRNPVRIAVKVRGRDGKDDQRTPASLQMCYLTTPPQAKLPTLLSLLTRTTPQPAKSIAYLSTCAAVDYFSNILPSLVNTLSPPGSKVNIIPLHGKQSPTLRTKHFASFLQSTTPTLLLTTDVAARGLDIPQVDLTIQLDPPSDPKTFLHRAGRAGRAGRKGLAVVCLLPGRETEGYPPFLEIRKTPVVPLSEATGITGIDAVLAATEDAKLSRRSATRIREIVLKDRAIHDKAQRAFVSWVRSYSKHAAGSIFRVQELDWVNEAQGWGLLRLPKMPELRHKPTSGAVEGGEEKADGKGEIDRSLGLSVDFTTYKYKDVQRERKRKAEQLEREEAKMQAAAANPAPTTTHKTDKPVSAKQSSKRRKEKAFSDKKEAVAVAQARREKKAKKRAATRWERMTEEERMKERETAEMVGRVRETVKEKGDA